MKVQELIKKYEDAKKLKKDYDFKKHIRREYLPYAEKCALAKSVVDSTSYVEVNEIKLYKRDTKSMLFIFTMKLIEQYTDIEINVPEIMKEYDVLMESGVMNNLMTQIPEEEISILRGMVDMERDDLEINTRSIVSFLETKSDALKAFVDVFAKVLEKPEIQTKIAELIR